MVERLVVGTQDVLVADEAVRRVYQLVRSHLADATMPVLIHGETGVGKELVAAALHEWSVRKDRPFVAVNCAALPDTLVESVLFGHRRGAFTGADTDQQGLIPAAHGGTLFLDEVGEMSENAQSKLLRVMETKRVRPVGSSTEVPADVRVVAATNRSLRSEVRRGAFRKDLYFRLRGAALTIPPLRERPDDLLALATHFYGEACERAGRPPLGIAADFLEVLRAYHWPGNVRELEAAMSYLGIVVEGSDLRGHHFGNWCEATIDLLSDSMMSSGSGAPTTDSLVFKPIGEEIAELERDRMRRALLATGGKRNEAAALIQMPLRTFSTKLKQYELDRLNYSDPGGS